MQSELTEKSLEDSDRFFEFAMEVIKRSVNGESIETPKEAIVIQFQRILAEKIRKVLLERSQKVIEQLKIDQAEKAENLEEMSQVSSEEDSDLD